jgi:fructose-1,6-bisphosphatase/inositol monophosphatase family enzyme
MDICSQSVKDDLAFAVRVAMGIVERNQGGHLPEDPEVKDDKTLVTKIDREVRESLVPYFQRIFPEAMIMAEEGDNIGQSEWIIMFDPLDGTRAFSCGLATSTVIAAIYNSARKQVDACVIGEPATNRVWSAFGGETTELDGPVKVWGGQLDEQSTIFLDVPHGFTRNGRQIMNHEQMARLFHELRGKKLAIPGSNGLIQSLVANGGQKVAGSITTAIGGPWDVCGVKLVLNAGGSAKAFRLKEDPDKSWLHERDPLNVLDYDILICGNSAATVETLVGHLMKVL